MGLAGSDRIKRIKEKHSVFEYARTVLNIPLRKPGDRYKSFGGGGNPTCVVFHEDWWYDFKLCMGGDVIDLCAVAKHDGDRGAAIRELGGDDPGWRSYTQQLGNLCYKWHEGLRESDLRYLRRRGILVETVRRLKIGFDGERLVIPYWKNGYIAYYISREMTKINNSTGQEGCPEGAYPCPEEGVPVTPPPVPVTPFDLNSSSENKKRSSKYKKAPLDGLNENIPWGLQSLQYESKHIVITEGAFDALSFEQEGFRVLSPMGGHFNRDALKQVIDICRTQESVVLCFDSDDAGNRFQTDMAQTLFKARIPFLCASLPSGVKDVSDHYAEGGDLHALIAGAEDGVTVLCSRMKDKQDFKSFIFEAARYVEKAELIGLFDLVDHFPEAWLAQIKKQAMSAPPEDLIAKEVMGKYRLKFYDALGFYEYEGGVWKRRGDSEIKSYVSEALGFYRTGGRVNSIFNLLKAETVSTEPFNQQAVFNFRNCVLDLNTGQTFPHSEAYMSSIQVPYDYDPEAYAPEWERFISEVAEDDERKMMLLQEIAGYVLYADNSLQKCFFLIGDGANGKSVYLDVLGDVFGAENVSNVEMSGLVEPFQRIHLLTSIVNISTETRSDVKGAESVFKQIVVGDTINGCYKNKDFLTFKPRTKLIIASNEYFKSRDTTTGFLRRICFVSFNARFTDDPDQGEFKADKDLPLKLKRFLPAIFNWAYQGYKILSDAKAFTVTDDQQELMAGFMRVSNPLVAYLDEMKITGRVSRERLYKDYAEWCKDAGHEAMSRTKFIQQIKQTIRQTKAKVSETKYSGERQFIFWGDGGADEALDRADEN